MLGTKSGVGKLLKDKFPDKILWHCLNHRLELAMGNALESISGTNGSQSFLEHLCSLYSQSPKNMRELDQCFHDLQTTLKRIGKVERYQYQQSGILSQLWHNIFTKLQMTKREKAQKRQDFKKCYLNFVKNLTLMADVLNELTNLSETLPSRNTTLPKACTLLNAYTKRMKSLISSPGEHSILAQ